MIQNIDVTAGRTEDFVQAAHELTDYVSKSATSWEQAYHFSDLIRKAIIEAEKGALLYGMCIAGAAAELAASEGRRKPQELDFAKAAEQYQKYQKELVKNESW